MSGPGQYTHVPRTTRSVENDLRRWAPGADDTGEPATCATCGRGLTITDGEIRAALGPLPTKCRHCRPTRREARERGLTR
jgi:hypothetical protein